MSAPRTVLTAHRLYELPLEILLQIAQRIAKGTQDCGSCGTPLTFETETPLATLVTQGDTVAASLICETCVDTLGEIGAAKAAARYLGFEDQEVRHLHPTTGVTQ